MIESIHEWAVEWFEDGSVEFTIVAIRRYAYVNDIQRGPLTAGFVWHLKYHLCIYCTRYLLYIPYSCPPTPCSVRSGRARSKGPCSLAARLIADLLFSEGCHVEGWRFFFFGVLDFFSFDVVNRKYQGQEVQQREDRVLIQQLAAMGSISIREWPHPCWLGYSKAAQMRFQIEGHYTTEVGSNERGGSQILHLYSIASLVTNRKKSRPVNAPSTSSCLRVKVCLPGVRFVFDQSIC